MTVKELIEQLQALDPDGEKEVIITGEYETLSIIDINIYPMYEKEIHIDVN